MINLKGAKVEGTITINGRSYAQNEDGSLREATADDLAAQQARAEAYRSEHDSRRAAHRATVEGAPSYHFGDIAGGDIIHSEITITQTTVSESGGGALGLLAALLGIK